MSERWHPVIGWTGSNAKRDYSTEARPRAACQHCGVEMRADGILRHIRRAHAQEAAA